MHAQREPTPRRPQFIPQFLIPRLLRLYLLTLFLCLLLIALLHPRDRGFLRPLSLQLRLSIQAHEVEAHAYGPEPAAPKPVVLTPRGGTEACDLFVVEEGDVFEGLEGHVGERLGEVYRVKESVRGRLGDEDQGTRPGVEGHEGEEAERHSGLGEEAAQVCEGGGQIGGWRYEGGGGREGFGVDWLRGGGGEAAAEECAEAGYGLEGGGPWGEATG